MGRASKVSKQTQVVRAPVSKIALPVGKTQAVADLGVGVRISVFEEGVAQEIRIGVATVARAHVHR